MTMIRATRNMVHIPILIGTVQASLGVVLDMHCSAATDVPERPPATGAGDALSPGARCGWRNRCADSRFARRHGA